MLVSLGPNVPMTYANTSTAFLLLRTNTEPISMKFVGGNLYHHFGKITPGTT